MSISTITTITIGEVPLTNFSQLVIEQKLNTHHKFSIVYSIPFEIIGNSLESIKNYIGSKVLITIKPSQFGIDNELQFRGIVSEAKLLRADGASGKILINGFSPTFQMEGLPDTRSYTNKKIADIAQQIIGRYPSDKLEPIINLEEEETTPYVVQYKENDFQFLSRIAAKKGIWFYYNGRELILGKPVSKNRILNYGEWLTSFNIEMKAKPVNFNFFSYDPTVSKSENLSSGTINLQPNTITDYLIQNSKSFFPHEANMLYNNPIQEGRIQQHLENRVKTQLQSQVSDLLMATGTSDVPSIRLGDIIKITDPGFSSSVMDVIKLPSKEYGSFYVTDILHVCNESGNYFNNFQGIPADSICPPYTNVFQTPVAEAQSAIVVNNNDPKGLSRIQVQFPWQKINNEKTPWTRIVTPYAGNGKGMHIIPEIGEEVMVDFESRNAEKPVILGSMFNGSGKSGHGGEGNHQKGFHTRSGNKLLLNDQIGSVLLEDHGQTSMKFDGSGNSSLGTSSTQTITVGGNKETPEGQANLKMDKDGNITLEGKTNITLKVGDNTIIITKEGIKTTAAQGDIDINAETGLLKAHSTNTMTIKTDAALTITGGPSANISSGDTNIM